MIYGFDCGKDSYLHLMTYDTLLSQRLLTVCQRNLLPPSAEGNPYAIYHNASSGSFMTNYWSGQCCKLQDRNLNRNS